MYVYTVDYGDLFQFDEIYIRIVVMSLKFNKDAVEYLAKLLKETGLKEVKYQDGDICIEFKQNSSADIQYAVPQNVMQQGNMPHNIPQSNVISQPDSQPGIVGGKDSTSSDGYESIKSPIVGTLYISPKPGVAPFIQKGSKIKEGDVLFIIEAMKVMNEVTATSSGTIEEILVQDGSPIEFDQILAKVS